MKNKWTPAAAAVLAAGVLFSGTAYAAPVATEQAAAENKGETQQLRSIDKQLNKIEEKLLRYKEKMEIIAKEPAPAEETAAASEETAVEEKPVTEEPTAVEKEEAQVEKELSEYPGYRGKFQALQNRLNAVSNQLTSLAAKGTDVSKQQARVAQLQETVKSVLASIGQVEKEVHETIKADKTVKQREAKKNITLTKEWNVQFSKKLNAKTLSTLDIVVLDSAQQLVETTFKYDEATKTIVITPASAYKPGETYTLYIGKNIGALDGQSLKNSVKMSFTTAAGTTAAAAVNQFSDVSDRYDAAVDHMVSNNISQGIGGNKFGVTQNIKRVDAAVMLAKALQLNTESAKVSNFKDVPQRAEAAVNALVANGIVSGKTATTFGADQTLTRGELALILTRAYGLTSTKAHTFTDVPPRYNEAVAALVATGLTSGKSKTAFGTADAVTRGEFARFLHGSVSVPPELTVTNIY